MAKYDVDEVKLRQLEEYIDSLEQKEGALIGVLYKAQEIFGYLPKDVQLFIARKLGITAAKVYGVATFYSYFTMEPRGKHVINVCMGTACFVKGADKILEEIKKELDIKDGNMSKDGLFTVDTLRCVGACGLAPVVMVDGKVYGRVKVEEVKGILDEYRE
ncbi:NADH-quinone oxidoreductase subunit NuoE [Caloramator sp. Dgby_cultured_2]|uniref:NADH-quinone oxidoreductase subunit NuoE n=1 Tax=Caloramator sp. Dgby_cultured_2 TaxID=3029174 RepID=UPI00237E5309|nr:NADH-quinone oxidoreductase subunit NuoE [Caloramator sp. Dgby_cultured_2]WDU82652.1 NADH-quinone oxidoreductase subunit NuoE [Caloramator sp. Dgby_cultured_2]